MKRSPQRPLPTQETVEARLQQLVATGRVTCERAEPLPRARPLRRPDLRLGDAIAEDRAEGLETLPGRRTRSSG